MWYNVCSKAIKGEKYTASPITEKGGMCLGDKKTKRAVQNMNREPFAGEPAVRMTGVIKAHDSAGNAFSVGVVTFERFDTDNYQITVSPRWSVIDALPGNVFKGLAGLDLGGRLASYCRRNILPRFIAERVPGPERPDLTALFPIEPPGADRAFAWLLETQGRLGGDNLTMEKAEDAGIVRFTTASSILAEPLTPLHTVTLPNLRDVASSNVDFRRSMLHILASGAEVELTDEGRKLSGEEYCTMLRLLLLQEGLDKSYRHRQRRAGIDAAKEAGKYTGRKRIPVDNELLEQIAASHAQGKVSTADAMKSLGIPSRSTFYRRLREVRGG
ncbi:MAG: recombinase family protein [Clostridia bacterium]|nr:recombinase family protein [Clostridia bacterium]